VLIGSATYSRCRRLSRIVTSLRANRRILPEPNLSQPVNITNGPQGTPQSIVRLAESIFQDQNFLRLAFSGPIQVLLIALAVPARVIFIKRAAPELRIGRAGRRSAKNEMPRARWARTTA